MTSMARLISAIPSQPVWTDRLLASDWYHFDRLISVLRDDNHWGQDQLASVSAESLRVLRHLPDPRQEGIFQGRGLVVGYVQSGKTANYTAVAARAVDAGYRIVIVLSGIHDALRNQTQNRLERELTGHQGRRLAPAESGQEWIALTTPSDDFSDRDQDKRILQSPAPFLAVVKKNTAVLQKLDRWLEGAQRYLEHMPVLVIDDEADQASINTKGNRPPDPALDETTDADDGPKPSLTNGLIRSILGRLPRAAYVAYTATPFANILIDPEAHDREAGADLFPRDFVLQLPRPTGYTGTEELFGASAQGRDVLKNIPVEDVSVLRSSRKRTKAEVTLSAASPSIPQSLCDALLAFCIAGAIRKIRGFEGKAHTMLVHVSHLTSDQEWIATAIRAQLALWAAAADQGQDLQVLFGPALSALKPGIDGTWTGVEIAHGAERVLRQIVVLELNSLAGENLEYDEKPGRQIVAVGGNRLSRGLTLEGLTVSYFLRTTAMCDTLLQMARWYGFRRGYEDLIRIWTTDGIARWFSELALVEQSMRDSIVALSRAGRRPDQMAIRLRAHSDLLLTARNKGRTAVLRRDSWSGEHPQTVLLPLQEPARLDSNVNLTDRFLAMLKPVESSRGGYLARDVSPEVIAAYLRNYQIHEDIVAFRNDLLADWIMERTVAGELTNWTLFVPSTKEGGKVTLGGKTVGLVRRKRVSSDSIGILTDPAHEGVDLRQGPDAYLRDSGSYDAEAMRSARPATEGLLIIYALDPNYLGLSNPAAIIGLALSLPKTSDAGTTWVQNSMVSDA